MHSLMITIGNFFFRYRNHLFPVVVVALYALAPPPHDLFGSHNVELAKDLAAALLALAGLSLRGLVIGFAYIKRGGLNKKVYADNLVTEGIFGLCRNPLYLGNVLIYVGVFLAHGNPYVFTLGLCFFLFIYQSIIFAEEQYLLAKFGDAYRAYCADVPRWLPKIERFHEATKDMQFNMRRVILKDYPTITNTIVTLAFTEMYEYLVLPLTDGNRHYLFFLLAVSLCTGSAALVVRALKKRKWLTEELPA